MSKRITSREGGVLRWFRERKGKTQAELGPKSTIDRWERGLLPLDRATLVEVLGRQGIPPEAVDAALFADDLAHPPGEPSRLPAAGRQLVEGGAAAGGMGAAKAARAELYAGLRRQGAPAARQWAKERWDILKKLPAEAQERAVEVLLGDDRSWALVVKICLASEAAAADRADEALRRAQLAVRIAQHDPWEESFRLRLLGWVEPFVSNAYRVGGNLPAAAEEFALADQHWSKGEGGDPAGLLDAAYRLELKASLFMYQDGQTQEALSLLEAALAGARSDHVRGRLLVSKATTLILAGEYEPALAMLKKAEPLIDPRQDPRLPCVLLFNRTVLYCHLDCYQDAASLLPRVETLAEALRTELDAWRLRWLKARTWVGLGHREAAIKALSEVREHFETDKIAYDYALVSTELATLLLERGENRRVKEIADQMKWIFQGQRVHKEALAALALFCHAAKAEEAEAGWTRRLVKYLYRAQHNPNLQFEG
jgi:tetratricopeptide (TPR) repeat protein